MANVFAEAPEPEQIEALTHPAAEAPAAPPIDGLLR